MGIKTKSEKNRDRELKFRRARKALVLYINRCSELKRQYMAHGKRAAEIGDANMKRQFASGYVGLHDQIQRAEKMMLLMDGMKLRHDATQVAGDFVAFTQDVAGALLSGLSEKDITAMQEKLDRSMARADMLDGSLGSALDSMSQSVIASPLAAPESVDLTEKMFDQEAANAPVDARIADAERLMARR